MKSILFSLTITTLIAGHAFALPASTCGPLGDLTQLVASWRDQGLPFSNSLNKVSREAQRLGLPSNLAPLVVDFVYNKYPNESPPFLAQTIKLSCGQS